MNQKSERSLERLLKLAGERDMPAAESMERARAAAHESWQRMLRQPAEPTMPRRHSMLLWSLAAAASIVLAVAWFNLYRAQPAPVFVARVVSAESGSAVRAPARILSGESFATQAGRAALTMGDSLSLRVAANTRLRFAAADRLTLLEGNLYVDSGGINAGSPLRIETPAGEVRHVGTQFQVSVSGEITRVRVREGRVLLTPRNALDRQDLAAGDELEVAGTQAQLRRGLPSYGAGWEWATSIGPAFAIENRPLAEFLAWLSREHGWQLRYSAESMQQRTHEIRLHGSLEGLDARGMLERVSLITGVPLEVRDGALLVGAPVAAR